MALSTAISTSLLHWDKTTATFTIEASRLGWPAGSFAESVQVRSAKTGRTVTFRQVRKVFDSSGEDCVAVEYEANDRSAGPMRLVVLND